MKTKFLLTTILLLAFGCFVAAEAQTEQLLEIQIHEQKTFSRSNLKIKFVSLIEDSRCPIGTNCVWAGNAKIKIEISRGKSSKTFELSTMLEPKSATYKGFQIKLVSLTPVPGENIRINRNGYVAALAVSRLTR